MAKKFRNCDIVIATGPFAGRRTPPPHAGSGGGMEHQDIPVGAMGLYHGKVAGVPGMHDVEFELPDGFVRVEASPEQIQHA